MRNNKYKILAIIVVILCCLGLYFGFSGKEETIEVSNIEENTIKTYEMSKEDIAELPSTEITEQTEEDEQEVSAEQEVEDEGFELQGEIAYEGDRANTWNVELGDYIGLTYYNQTDSRWRNHMYSSVGDSSQTIGTSGCGPTSAAMIVTATRGAITPDQMGDLFVQYGYRSSNNGTYWSAFRAVADEFNIGYTETSDIQRALQLLQSNNYVVVSVGNGLFTTGGHFIVLTELNGDTITVFDPYLYAGKFDTSTRRGKVIVDGNKVYVSINNFINYANAKGFFCYEHDGNVQENTSTVTTSSNTVGQTRKTRVCYLYSNSNLTGTRYTYKANTTVTILQNISSNIDKVRVNVTGRVAYINTFNYTTSVSSDSTNNTVGQYKRLKNRTYLYSNSNLSGTKYTYLALTQVKIIRNVSSTVDYVYVVKTGRYAYVRNNVYK